MAETSTGLGHRYLGLAAVACVVAGDPPAAFDFDVAAVAGGSPAATQTFTS